MTCKICKGLYSIYTQNGLCFQCFQLQSQNNKKTRIDKLKHILEPMWKEYSQGHFWLDDKSRYKHENDFYNSTTDEQILTWKNKKNETRLEKLITLKDKIEKEIESLKIPFDNVENIPKCDNFITCISSSYW